MSTRVGFSIGGLQCSQVRSDEQEWSSSQSGDADEESMTHVDTGQGTKLTS
jgi:hypothetical protein